MRLPRLLVPVLLASLAVLPIGPVGASTVLRLDDGEIVDLAERIVHGRVLSKEVRRARDGVRIFTEYRVAPDELLKPLPRAAGIPGGPPALEPDGTLVFRQWGGELDGVRFYIPGVAELDPDEEVLLFIEPAGDPVERVGFTVGPALGNYGVERDPATGRATARRRLNGLELEDGGAGRGGPPVRPGPGDEAGRDLDDLKAAIRARIAR